jgi:hypothetical protein
VKTRVVYVYNNGATSEYRGVKSAEVSDGALRIKHLDGSMMFIPLHAFIGAEIVDEEE